MSRSRYAIGAGAALAALALTGAAGATSAWTVRFGYVPARAYQGLPASVSVLVKPRSARCSIVVRYSNGTTQPGLNAVVAATGGAQWTWTMSPSAPAGPAHVKVACGRSGSLSRVFTVVGGTVAHSKLAVVKTGYSQRPDSYGAGSSVSYGVVLNNPSADDDAEGVTVLVNFVDGTDHVLQTSTATVTAIAAGATFNLGGSASLASQTPVAKLEVVVQTKGFVPHALQLPALENVKILPSQFEPNWVGGVDGAVINVNQTHLLQSASLSIVLFDGAGNVVGGGSGYIFATLPPERGPTSTRTPGSPRCRSTMRRPPRSPSSRRTPRRSRPDPPARDSVDGVVQDERDHVHREDREGQRREECRRDDVRVGVGIEPHSRRVW